MNIEDESFLDISTVVKRKNSSISFKGANPTFVWGGKWFRNLNGKEHSAGDK
jgi:hypothetical protein